MDFSSSNPNVKFATGEEIKNNPGFMYDIESGEVNLPDPNVVLDKVIEILEYMNTPEIKALTKKIDTANNHINTVKDSSLKSQLEDERDTLENRYREQMEVRFPQFSMRYYALFMKVISRENLTPLFRMLSEIDNIRTGGKSIEKAEEDIGMSLFNEYVSPSLNQKK